MNEANKHYPRTHADQVAADAATFAAADGVFEYSAQPGYETSAAQTTQEAREKIKQDLDTALNNIRF